MCGAGRRQMDLRLVRSEDGRHQSNACFSMEIRRIILHHTSKALVVLQGRATVQSTVGIPTSAPLAALC